MKEKVRVSVIMAAAGRGTRMNTDVSKQYIGICGRPVLAWALQAFERIGQVGEIILVVNEKDVDYCRKNIVEEYGFGKVKRIVPGGTTRQESVYNGIRQIGESADVVLVHDGARPFVDTNSIMNSIYAAYEYGAACVAVPVKDTIKTADEGGFVAATLERSALWSIQTPQAFRYDLLAEAHEKARKDGFNGTDDAVLVERLGHELKLVMGSYFNIKITTKEDLVLAGAIAEGIVKGCANEAGV